MMISVQFGSLSNLGLEQHGNVIATSTCMKSINAHCPSPVIAAPTASHAENPKIHLYPKNTQKCEILLTEKENSALNTTTEMTSCYHTST